MQCLQMADGRRRTHRYYSQPVDESGAVGTGTVDRASTVADISSAYKYVSDINGMMLQVGTVSVSFMCSKFPVLH